MGLSIDREKVIKDLESLRDICNAKSNMAIGNGKVAWAGYANTAYDALALLKEQERIIKLYEKAEPFLHSHGWDWTQVEGWVKQEKVGEVNG